MSEKRRVARRYNGTMPSGGRGCSGFGDSQSKDYVIGDYVDQTTLIRGRKITIKNVEVRECGCQTFWKIEQMIKPLLDEPDRTVVSWNKEKERWE